MFLKYCKINVEKDDKNNNIKDKKESSQSINAIKPKFWIGKSNIKMEKVQLCQGIKIALNLSFKKICSLIYYFETKGIIALAFNYYDSP